MKEKLFLLLGCAVSCWPVNSKGKTIVLRGKLRRGHCVCVCVCVRAGWLGDALTWPLFLMLDVFHFRMSSKLVTLTECNSHCCVTSFFLCYDFIFE